MEAVTVEAVTVEAVTVEVVMMEEEVVVVGMAEVVVMAEAFDVVTKPRLLGHGDLHPA